MTIGSIQHVSQSVFGSDHYLDRIEPERKHVHHLVEQRQPAFLVHHAF